MNLRALIVIAMSASSCAALDLPTDLLVLRTNYDLEPLEKAAQGETLVFRVYVRPALSPTEYALEGRLKIPEIGEASGSLTLFEQTAGETKIRPFKLTHSQAREVHGWFSEAHFLDPKVKETVDVPVLDGVELVVEGFIGAVIFASIEMQATRRHRGYFLSASIRSVSGKKSPTSRNEKA